MIKGTKREREGGRGACERIEREVARINHSRRKERGRERVNPIVERKGYYSSAHTHTRRKR